jgi:hypothetical protein
MKPELSHLRGTHLQNKGTKGAQPLRVNIPTVSSESMNNEDNMANSNRITTDKVVNNKPNDSSTSIQPECPSNTLKRTISKRKRESSIAIDIETVSSESMHNEDNMLNNNRIIHDKHVDNQLNDLNILIESEGPSNILKPGTRKIKRENSNAISTISLANEESKPIRDIHTGIYLGTTKKTTRPGSAFFNLPGMTEDVFLSKDHSSFIHWSRESIKRSNSKTVKSTFYKQPNDSGVRTVSELTTILGHLDSSVRYSVNSIRDPIRRCSNISSIHLGNFPSNN